MIELPYDLTTKEIKFFSSHTANATHLSFENSPEAFDVVGMYISSNLFTTFVVNELMNVSILRYTAIHLESVRVE